MCPDFYLLTEDCLNYSNHGKSMALYLTDSQLGVCSIDTTQSGSKNFEPGEQISVRIVLQ